MRNTSFRASLALERMVVGIGTNPGLREAQAQTVTVTSSGSGWTITYNTNLWFTYTASAKKITDQFGKLIGTNVTASTITYFTNGCQIAVTVAENPGGDTWTNAMYTLVQFRN